MRRCILDEASHRWMTLTSHAGHKMRSVIQNCIINDSYIYADAHIESTISRRHGTLCPQISRYVKVACNVSNVTTTIKQRYCQYGRFAEHELLAGTLLIFYLRKGKLTSKKRIVQKIWVLNGLQSTTAIHTVLWTQTVTKHINLFVITKLTAAMLTSR